MKYRDQKIQVVREKGKEKGNWREWGDGFKNEKTNNGQDPRPSLPISNVSPVSIASYDLWPGIKYSEPQNFSLPQSPSERGSQKNYH